MSLDYYNKLKYNRKLTQSKGEIAWEAVYQAWGNTVTVEWQEVAQELNPIQLNSIEQAYLLQPHRFQGQIYDVETGLHYNRFRYYDPDIGRFISHDPIGLLGGDNHFQYAPNPVEWVDPWGLCCKCPTKKDHHDSNSRREALRKAKEDARIPQGQQPKVTREYLEDGFGNKVMKDGQPVTTRNYNYTNIDGKRVVIQEHSYGHVKAATNKGLEPHFNVRPIENTQTGSVSGTYGHYNFPK